MVPPLYVFKMEKYKQLVGYLCFIVEHIYN
jgi:hypothetical protein